MLIDLTNFAGMAPSVHPTALPANAAQVASNCILGLGALRPLKGTTNVIAPSKAGTVLSIYPFASKWLNWISDVNVCRAPQPDDSWDRLYFSGGAAFVPQYTLPALATSGSDYPTASYNLGIPMPTTAPTIEVVGTISDPDPTLVETRSYVYTFVSAYGEEGPPSPVSVSVDVAPGQSVNLSALEVSAGLGYNLSQKRIYRTNTGTTSTEFQLVATIAIANATYSDTVASANLGLVLPSESWDPPPPGLHSITPLSNGALAGLYKKQVCFSEPYQPHAWPLAYRKPLDSLGIALGAYGNSVLVATESFPHVVTGSHPEAMGIERSEEGGACVSKRGLVDLGYAVIWPAPQGLMLAGMSGIRLLTKDLFTQEDWAALVPSTIHAYLWDKKYVAFWTNSSGYAGFIFDPATNDLTYHSIAATAGYHDPLTGVLYLVVGGQIVTWDSATALSAVWKSKKFVLPKPANFSCAQVQADAYPQTVKFWADGALIHTRSVANANPFRLPGGFLPDSYEVEVTTTAAVTRVTLATSLAELAEL